MLATALVGYFVVAFANRELIASLSGARLNNDMICSGTKAAWPPWNSAELADLLPEMSMS